MLEEHSMAKEQIKSKERVAEHGEVFTNEREVNAMRDPARKVMNRFRILVSVVRVRHTIYPFFWLLETPAVY